MILPETFELAAWLDEAQLRYWIFGGNAVELVLGRDLRPHEDIDVFIAADHAHSAAALLERNAFVHHAGSLERGDVFYRRGELLVDLVPIDDRQDPPRGLGDFTSLRFPSGFLETFQVVHSLGPVRTLTPRMHLRMKEIVAEYYRMELREKDEIDRKHLMTLIESDACA